MGGTPDKPVSATSQSGYGEFLVPGVVQKQGVREVKRQRWVIVGRGL
jgi:hypothetical protein